MARFHLKILCSLLVLCLFHAGNNISVAKAARLNILTSFLPIYIFTKNVVGSRAGVDVTCLLPPEVDPHDYHMRPSDMKKIVSADLIIINGLGIEDFLVEILAEGRTKDTLLESSMGLPLIRGDNNGNEHHHYDDEYNPHTWVSPKMAALQVKNIAEFLSKADPEGRGEYLENAKKQIKVFEILQNEFLQNIKPLSSKKIVTFHRAFDYLARDTGIEILDVIYRSPGEEPSAGQLSSLIKLMKKNDVRLIFTEPQSTSKLPAIIAKEAGAEVFKLDPVSTGEFREEYYIEAMRKNMTILVEVLRKQSLR